MSVKTLAKQLPLYGQQAIGTSLNSLSVAGHMRRARWAVGRGETTRWAYRTFWSRTARDNEWWNTFLAAEKRRLSGAATLAPLPRAPATAPTATSTASTSWPSAAPPAPSAEQAEEPWGLAEEPWFPAAQHTTESEPEPPVPHAPSELTSACLPAQAPPPTPVPPYTPVPPPTPVPRLQQVREPGRSPRPAATPPTGPARPVPASVQRPTEPGSPVPVRPQTAPAGPVRTQPPTAAEPGRRPSAAYLALAQLGRTDGRVALSAADCTALEPLAAAWLDRGVSTDYLIRALTAGLPHPVGSPVGLVRRRLTDKIPPHLPTEDAASPREVPVRRLMMECTNCRAPGRPEALPDGLCRPCRTAHASGATGEPADVRDAPDTPGARDIGAYVAELRGLLRAP
ncbi:MarR family transcriptional regulator [Streptomyces sp. NPDC087897]|uniref:MarR family transcriptional regulator n=1 Tax=Streptomyces sp. NPDC087897 TaxID=3365817 RepID=UPI00382D5500